MDIEILDRLDSIKTSLATINAKLDVLEERLDTHIDADTGARLSIEKSVSVLHDAVHGNVCKNIEGLYPKYSSINDRLKSVEGKMAKALSFMIGILSFGIYKLIEKGIGWFKNAL